jgi:hypothetical protein
LWGSPNSPWRGPHGEEPRLLSHSHGCPLRWQPEPSWRRVLQVLVKGSWWHWMEQEWTDLPELWPRCRFGCKRNGCFKPLHFGVVCYIVKSSQPRWLWNPWTEWSATERKEGARRAVSVCEREQGCCNVGWNSLLVLVENLASACPVGQDIHKGLQI